MFTIRSAAVVLAVLLGGSSAAVRHWQAPRLDDDARQPMSASQAAISQSSAVLSRLDFTSPPNYPTNPNLYNNIAQLRTDCQAVHAILTDPDATSGWCQPIDDILTLSAGSTYFADTSPNPNAARDAFVGDYQSLKTKANCP